MQPRLTPSLTNPTAQVELAQVVVNYGRHLLLEHDDELIPAVTKGRKLKPVCGDYVKWQRPTEKEAVVEEIAPRRSFLQRHDLRQGARVLAANVDVLMIVLATEPTPDLALVDRYLVAGEYLELDLHIVFNKVDLLTDEEEAHWQKVLQPYLEMNYPIHWVSNKSGRGIDQLNTALTDRCGMFVGPSGAGKSSMIKSLVPDHAPRTQALSAASGQGQHTTTSTRLYRLPLEVGGSIIDSPGVRDFRLWEMSLQELAQTYREFRESIEYCKFSNCRHLNEPGCKILEGLQTGAVSTSRYDSYRQLAEIMLAAQKSF